MGNSKEKSKSKFIKGISVFLAGLLAGLGIGHNANKALPEGKENTEKIPEEITEYLPTETNDFKENLKYEIEEPAKTEKQILEENLQSKLNKIKSDEDLEKFILKDIKERYIEEYNKTYGTDYKADRIKLFYKAQSYSYVKDGKFYGKEEQPGAKIYNDQFAYRIYDSADNQLEAILATGTKSSYSSEDINILGKYTEALEAFRNIPHNPTEISKKLYKEGILNAYDISHKQNQENIRE